MFFNDMQKISFNKQQYPQLGGGPEPVAAANTTGLLGDIFGVSAAPACFTPPKQCWLPADKGKGNESYPLNLKEGKGGD